MTLLSPRLDVIERFRERIALGKRIRLYKEEFETLVAGFIQQLSLIEEPEAIRQLCQNEIALLEEGYPQLTLASDYIPRYRKAIEAAIATQQLPQSNHQYLHHQRVTGLPQQRHEHWALTFFKYSQDQYEDLDRRQAKTNRKRLLNLRQVNPWRYLNTLDELLCASGKFAARHRTIAIVGLTGRRFGEVVARGSFSLTAHPYLLHFEGQQKSDRAGYDIITLIPAELVLMHLERLRDMPELQPLMDGRQGDDLTAAINKFDVQVNRECDKLLMKSGVVPPLQGKKHVTIHNLRSLWGAIAAFFFCPPQHHEYAFLQHYLGHILESSATGHYFRYLLIDDQGDLLREKGVKLQEVPELPLLDEEEPETIGDEEYGPVDDPSALELAIAIDTPSSNLEPPPSRRTDMEIEALVQSLQQDWQQQLEAVQQELRTEQSDALSALKAELEEQFVTLRRQIQPDGHQHLVEQIELLEAENKAIAAERDQLQTELQKAQQDAQTTAKHLREAQAKLDSFRTLLLDESKDSKSSGSDAKPAQTPAPTDAKAHRGRGRAPGKAAQRAQVVFDALRAWNDQHPDQTLAFSPGLLENLFRINRKAAKNFCHEFQNEIEDHHAEIGVERVLTHNKGKDMDGFKTFAQQFQ